MINDPSKFGAFAASDPMQGGVVNSMPSASSATQSAAGPNPEWGTPVGTPTASPAGGGVLPTSVAGAGGGYGISGSGTPTTDGKGPGGFDRASGTAWLADGGGIPSPENAVSGNQPVDFDSALQAVQNALSFGRKKNGLPDQLTNSARAGNIGGGGAALDAPDTDNASQGMSPSGSGGIMTPMATDDSNYAEGGGVLDAPVKKPAGMSPSTYKDPPVLPMGPQTGLPKWIKKNDDDADDEDSPQRFAEGGAVDADGDNDGDEAPPAEAGQSDQTSDQGVLPQPGSQQAAPQGPSQQGQGTKDPKRLVGYVTGSDGVTPDIASAMESRVDPSGQMDPSERKLLAIAQAGGPQQAWGLMQHYRQKFNAYNAFAKAAAQGGQQKPADLHSSAQAATQAYANVPDGTSLMFQPTRGGMAVQVRQLANKNPGDNKSQQSFAEGGPVDDDAIGDPGGGFGTGPEQGVIPNGAGSEQLAAPDPNAIAGAPGAGPEQATPQQDYPYSPSASSTPLSLAGDAASRMLKGSNVLGAVKNFVLSIPQYLQFLTKEGQYDSVVEKGATTMLADVSKQDANTSQFLQGMQGRGAPARQQAPQQSGTPAPASMQPGGTHPNPNLALDQALVAQADELYPRHSAKWREFINSQMTAGATNQNKLDVENVKWNGRSTVQDAKNRGALDVQGARNEGAQQRNVNTNQTKRDIAATTQQGVNDRARMNAINGQLKTWITAKPGITPDELAKRVAPLVAAMGQDPQEVVRKFFAQGQQQAPAQQAPAQQQQGAQRKFYNGKWYTRGPNGEAVPEQ